MVDPAGLEAVLTLNYESSLAFFWSIGSLGIGSSGMTIHAAIYATIVHG